MLDNHRWARKKILSGYWVSFEILFLYPSPDLSCLDPTNAHHWPPILFICDLYSQALMTMGDDEFFGSTAARNPLTLDELVFFGRQLLNIAFTLYWRDDRILLQETNVSPQVRCTWEDVRDKATKCLLDIHAREYVPFLFSLPAS